MADNGEFAEEGFYNKKEKTASTFFFHFLFSHFGLFLIVALYAIAGAYIFMEIELPNEEINFEKKRGMAGEVNQTINYMAQLFWFYGEANWTDFAEYTNQVRVDLKQLETYVITAVSKYNYDGTVDGWDYSWTLSKSVLLTMTIMSTIGYGHIYPVTDYGKLFCIIYAIIGCPLLLVFLGNLGNSMADTFIYIYSRCCCRWCRSRRNEEELPANASKKHRKLLIDDEIGNEEYMPTDKMDVPITINLLLLSLYIALGAVLFAYWENWDLSSSCYFTFVTLSTIGYGDLVPGNAILDSSSGSGTIKMIICILYIVLGMALLSMCINLMQEQLVAKCRWLAREIGLNTKSDDVQMVDDDKDKKKKKKKKKKKDDSRDPELGPPMIGDSLSPPASPYPDSRSSSPYPDSRSSSPDSRSSSPDSRSSSANPKSPSPKPRSPSPKPRSPSPKPRSPSPKPRSPSPKPRSPSPKPRSPSPKPRSPSPKPKSAPPKPKSPPPKPKSAPPKPKSPPPKPKSAPPKPKSPPPKPRSPSPSPCSSPEPMPRIPGILDDF